MLFAAILGLILIVVSAVEAAPQEAADSKSRKQSIHLMIDSTGLRIHVGTTRKPPKQRAWRKLHIAVDRKTGNIVASELTASRARDATRVPPLLTQIQAPIASVAADSAYDKEAVYEAIEAHSPGRRTRVVIPPQRNATLSQNSNTCPSSLLIRDWTLGPGPPSSPCLRAWSAREGRC